MVIEAILLGLTLIALIFATISDIKIREVPDWLSYSLIAVALSLKAIHSLIYKEINIFLLGLLGFGIFFAIANIMYYTKQWGGGDAKLLMGLGTIFITYPKFLLDYFSPRLNIPFLLTLLINILVIGAIYGVVFAMVLAIKHKSQTKKELKALLEHEKVKGIRKILLLGSIITLAISFLIIKDSLLQIVLIAFVFFFLVLFYLTTFIKAVEKAAMYKHISVQKLTEGDWILNPIFVKKKLIYNPKSLGVTKHQIELIKKTRIKTVLVKEGIPFIPSFLIATLISLIFGNLFFI